MNEATPAITAIAVVTIGLAGLGYGLHALAAYGAAGSGSALVGIGVYLATWIALLVFIARAE